MYNNFLVRLHGEYNTSLASYKHHVNLLLQSIISTDEDPSLRIESFAITNLRGVSTKLNLVMSKLLLYFRHTHRLRSESVTDDPYLTIFNKLVY